MNNKFLELREKYPDFIYDSYKIDDIDNSYLITFYFVIPNLVKFNPTLRIDKKYITNEELDKNFINYLVFHIGLIELISYVKCTCSPNIIIRAGYINEEQIKFFKKLYYYGLGEFLYVNNVDVEMDNLFKLVIESEEKKVLDVNYKGIGNLIPVGGGKDSNVCLELLRDDYEDNSCFMLNPKKVYLDCVEVAGYSDSKVIKVYRTIDKNLLDLNKKGFLNGHTPFSSLLAFVTYLVAYLSNKRYIVLSNEGSANESTVIGTKVNHQYSKTFEFENDFNQYTIKYFKIDIKYFSLLRPLTEFQIGMLFSKLDKFHKVFKSCNVGSKGNEWKWCCKCPKCLFVYIILSPFLYKEKLLKIFDCDLFENKELLEIFNELLGYADTKPFECVGTYSEVRYAVSLTINKLDKLDEELPYLLKYYKDNYELELDLNMEKRYNSEHNIDLYFEEILKKELDKYVR